MSEISLKEVTDYLLNTSADEIRISIKISGKTWILPINKMRTMVLHIKDKSNAVVLSYTDKEFII